MCIRSPSLDKRSLSVRMCRGNSAQSFLMYGSSPHLRPARLLDAVSAEGFNPVMGVSSHRGSLAFQLCAYSVCLVLYNVE